MARCMRRQGVQLLTELRVIDNSVPARTIAKCAFVFRRRKIAVVGERIKVACQGKMQNALVTGTRGYGPASVHMHPAFGENTCVLLDNNFEPVGTRIRGPLPTCLRKLGSKTAKVCAMATRFV
eukprot:scpid94722/ scgid20325/ 39S ribosomal protein L14, mitochondrial